MSYTGACLFCGGAMECSERGRPRLYCSEACRKRYVRQFTDSRPAEKRRVLLDTWAREFARPVADQLRGILLDHGEDAARRTAAAIRLAVAEDRRWAELRQAAGPTEHGRHLAQLLDRRDPRVVKFLEECGL